MEGQQTTLEDARQLCCDRWQSKMLALLGGVATSVVILDMWPVSLIAQHLPGMMPITSTFGSSGNGRGLKDTSPFLGSEMNSRSFSI